MDGSWTLFWCAGVRGAPTARDWIEPNSFPSSVRDVADTITKFLGHRKNIPLFAKARHWESDLSVSWRRAFDNQLVRPHSAKH